MVETPFSPASPAEPLVVMGAGLMAALLFARTHRRALERARRSEASFRELLRIGTDEGHEGVTPREVEQLADLRLVGG